MTHIGLVLDWQGGWLGGIDYVRNLALAIGHLPAAERADVRITLIHETPLEPGLEEELAPHLAGIVDRKVRQPSRSAGNNLAWWLQRRFRGQEHPRFARFVRDQGIDFVYPCPVRRGRGSGFRAAAWIPDFQHRHLPHLFTAEDLAARNRLFDGLAADADAVVLSSEAVAEDFRRFHPAHAAKGHVLHFTVWPDAPAAADEPARTAQAYALPERFLLVCNQLWQHKNHGLLLEALHRLKAGGKATTMVWTGPLGDYRRRGYLEETLQKIHRLGLASDVRVLGVVPRAEQIQLMRRALAVLQPSLFEGWSTVVELALSLGRPLLLSDLPVHKEQVPGGPFFARESADDLAAALERLGADLAPGPDLRAEAAGRADAQARALAFARGFLTLARDRA